ncbi:leucyl aminopeptidase [Actinocatenispora sera]|uniref:leucyl aminopeptidase n=1 Tax=Actinocatenispora sera TaxID=390989 RepID=UPI0033DD7ADE
MSSLALADTNPASLSTDAVVVGLYQSADGAPTLAPGAAELDAAFDHRLVDTLVLLGATGAVGEVTRLASLGTVPAPLVAAVGLGPADAADDEAVRRAAGAAARALAGSATVALALPALRPAAEGAALGGYRFTRYRAASGADRAPVAKIVLLVPDAKDKAARAELKRATALADAATFTRDCVNTPGNDLHPPAFADAVAKAATKAGLAVEVLDEKALRKGGYGGILAVGLGSAKPPRLVRLAYSPRGKATAKVALVGKGITFDTGGLSIKPPKGMWEMKSDMAGAAAVAGAMLAIAALKPKVEVVAYLPMAENMPSGSAYRPGDVVTMYSGTKVEVLNTDAEGRMVLADAIARACEDDPDYLFETSTLTGGQVTSLGNRIGGVMGSESLHERVRAAGERVGEPIWPMPLPEEIAKLMTSDVADLSQVATGMDRSGHMLQGGYFLSRFVADGVDWAHLDVAGPAYHESEEYGYLPKGATAVPLRTLVELVGDVAENG